MLNFLHTFFRESGLRKLHLWVISPILFIALIPAAICLLMIAAPIVGFVSKRPPNTQISVFHKGLINRIKMFIEEKLHEITNYKELKRKWGYALLNQNGKFTDPVPNCKLVFFEFSYTLRTI